jgi:transcription elongation factor Elf1
MTDSLPSKERIKLALGEWRRLGLSDEWLLNRIYEAAEPSSAHEPPAPQRMRIAFQPQGRCLWHEDCAKVSSGVMHEVEREESRSLLECLNCGQRGYYPKGAVGSVCVDVVTSSSQPRCNGITGWKNARCTKPAGHDGRCEFSPGASQPPAPVAPTWTCPNCETADEFTVTHHGPDDLGAVYPVMICRICDTTVSDYRAEQIRAICQNNPSVRLSPTKEGKHG